MQPAQLYSLYFNIYPLQARGRPGDLHRRSRAENGLAIQHASNDLKHDEEIVVAALEQAKKWPRPDGPEYLFRTYIPQVMSKNQRVRSAARLG